MSWRKREPLKIGGGSRVTGHRVSGGSLDKTQWEEENKRVSVYQIQMLMFTALADLDIIASDILRFVVDDLWRTEIAWDGCSFVGAHGYCYAQEYFCIS